MQTSLFPHYKPSSPQNHSTRKHQFMDLLCYPDSQFLKRRDYNLLMRNGKGTCTPWGLKDLIFLFGWFFWWFYFSLPCLAPEPPMAGEGIGLSGMHCRACPEYVNDKCTYVSCYHSGANKLEGRYIKSDHSQTRWEKEKIEWKSLFCFSQ